MAKMSIKEIPAPLTNGQAIAAHILLDRKLISDISEVTKQYNMGLYDEILSVGFVLDLNAEYIVNTQNLLDQAGMKHSRMMELIRTYKTINNELINPSTK